MTHKINDGSWIIVCLIVCLFTGTKGQTDPTNIVCTALNSTALALTWTSATDATVIGYYVDVERVDGLRVEPDIPTADLSSRSYSNHDTSGLGKYGTYDITIFSYTSSSNLTKYVTTCTTSEDVPDLAPYNFGCTSYSISAIQCSWDDLEQVYWNGIAQGYRVQWLKTTNVSELYSTTVDGNTTTTLLTSLQYATTYTLLLNAYTSIGHGTVYTTTTAATKGQTVEVVENTTRYYCNEAVPGMIEFGWEEMPCTIYMGTIGALFIICLTFVCVCACQACCQKAGGGNDLSVNVFSSETRKERFQDDASDSDDESVPPINGKRRLQDDDFVNNDETDYDDDGDGENEEEYDNQGYRSSSNLDNKYNDRDTATPGDERATATPGNNKNKTTTASGDNNTNTPTNKADNKERSPVNDGHTPDDDDGDRETVTPGNEIGSEEEDEEENNDQNNRASNKRELNKPNVKTKQRAANANPVQNNTTDNTFIDSDYDSQSDSEFADDLNMENGAVIPIVSNMNRSTRNKKGNVQKSKKQSKTVTEVTVHQTDPELSEQHKTMDNKLTKTSIAGMNHPVNKYRTETGGKNRKTANDNKAHIGTSGADEDMINEQYDSEWDVSANDGGTKQTNQSLKASEEGDTWDTSWDNDDNWGDTTVSNAGAKRQATRQKVFQMNKVPISNNIKKGVPVAAKFFNDNYNGRPGVGPSNKAINGKNNIKQASEWDDWGDEWEDTTTDQDVQPTVNGFSTQQPRLSKGTKHGQNITKNVNLIGHINKSSEQNSNWDDWGEPDTGNIAQTAAHGFIINGADSSVAKNDPDLTRNDNSISHAKRSNKQNSNWNEWDESSEPDTDNVTQQTRNGFFTNPARSPVSAKNGSNMSKNMNLRNRPVNHTVIRQGKVNGHMKRSNPSKGLSDISESYQADQVNSDESADEPQHGMDTQVQNNFRNSLNKPGNHQSSNSHPKVYADSSDRHKAGPFGQKNVNHAVNKRQTASNIGNKAGVTPQEGKGQTKTTSVEFQNKFYIEDEIENVQTTINGDDPSDLKRPKSEKNGRMIPTNAWHSQKRPGSDNVKSRRTTVIKPIPKVQSWTALEPEPVLDADRLGKKFPFLNVGPAGQSDTQSMKKSASETDVQKFMPNATERPRKTSEIIQTDKRKAVIDAFTNKPEKSKSKDSSLVYGFGIHQRFKQIAQAWIGKVRMKKNPVKTVNSEWF
ncbi:hypothetical protein ACF0H5_017463 [Mactra antiquata]